MSKIKKVIVLLLLLPFIWILIFFTSYRPLLPGYHKFYYTPEKYKALKENIKNNRAKIFKEYKEAGSGQDKVIIEAKQKFIKMTVRDIFPYWYGTFWTFNGHTQIPGKSSIACGYFVTTILRDVGCEISRTKLAQAPSEEMIKKMIDKKWIKRYNNITIEKFVRAIKEEGDGISVVGLDNHTGFLVCGKGSLSFIHSSGRFPFCVVKEEAENSIVLQKSKYKVVGLLTKDNNFIEKWISGSGVN